MLTDKDIEIVDLRGRMHNLETLAQRYRDALLTICDPSKCKWSAPEMFHIADAALKGSTTAKDCD